MIPKSGIIYYYEWHGSKPAPKKASRQPLRILGIGLIALALGGLTGPLTPLIRLEGGYRIMQAKAGAEHLLASLKPEKTSPNATVKPVLFTPLTAPDGSAIVPVDTDFGLIIPKIGVNAKVIPSVNPTDPGDYEKALLEGVAHSSTSFFPDENGTVYLFSHSTSYDWFVKDLNAVFYLVKNLDTGDTVVLMYKGHQYTYKITEKKVVSPEAVAYLVPHAGTKNLILQPAGLRDLPPSGSLFLPIS